MVATGALASGTAAALATANLCFGLLPPSDQWASSSELPGESAAFELRDRVAGNVELAKNVSRPEPRELLAPPPNRRAGLVNRVRPLGKRQQIANRNLWVWRLHFTL